MRGEEFDARDYRLRVCDKVNDLIDGRQIIDLVLRDRDPELALEQADQISLVGVVSTQIVLETRIARGEVFVNPQLFGHDLDDS